MVGQGGALRASRQLFQQFFDELKQVIHLLELATRVLVQFAVAGEDVQLFEQLNGLAGAQVELRTRVLGLRHSRSFVFRHGLIVPMYLLKI